jgi:hypothetical protein
MVKLGFETEFCKSGENTLNGVFSRRESDKGKAQPYVR